MERENIYKVLNSLINKNKDTDYGKRYSFAEITSLEDYQAKVPVSDYDIYASFVELTSRIGEHDIVTSSKPFAYALTSGTLGVPKRFPITKEHINPYVKIFEKLVLSAHGKTLLLFDSISGYKKYYDKSDLDTILGAILLVDKKKLEMNVIKELLHQNKIVNPEPVLYPSELTNQTYVRLIFALKEKKLEQIVSPFSLGIWEMFKCLEENWVALVNDIKNGTINGDIDVSKAEAERILAYIKPDPARADELAAIFENGFDSSIAKKIWPNLKKVIAASSGPFKIYADRYSDYLQGIEIDNGFYAASETIIGRATGKDDLFELIEENSVFEFTEVDNENAKPVFSCDVEAGKLYEVLVTSNAGLYRYRLTDVISIEKVENEKVFLKYVGRSKNRFTLNGCKVYESDIYSIVKNLEEKTGVKVYDYCVHVNDDKESDLLLVDLSDSQENIDKLKGITAEQLEDITGMPVKQLQPYSQLLYRDVQKIRKQVSPDQIKPIRFLVTPQTEKFFMKLIQE